MEKEEPRQTFPLGEIARRLQLKLHGPEGICIRGVCALQDGRRDCIAFLANSAYEQYLSDTRAGAVILTPDKVGSCPVPALEAGDPYLAFARAAKLFQSQPEAQSGTHSSACVSAKARVSDGAAIGPQCTVAAGAIIEAGAVLGPGCTVAEDCHIGRDSCLVARVTLCRGVCLGARVVIQPGAVVGGRGFGLARDEGRWVDVPQLGGVRVGDDVEIGANTTIDRGALEDTLIGEGVKLDNQIQIGHNVSIGAHTAIAGCTGIAGSTRIGRHCMIGGHVGISGHIEIADGVVLAGKAMVTKSITRSGVYASGLPVSSAAKWRRQIARIRRLDKMEKKLKNLSQFIDSKEDSL